MGKPKNTADKQKLKKLISRLPFWPWHPFLLAVWFIVFQAAHNIEEAQVAFVKRPLIISFTILGLFYLVSLLISICSRKVGLVLSLLVILFFGFGHIQQLINNVNEFTPLLRPLGEGRDLLVLLIAGFTLAAYLIIKSPRKFGQTTKFINLIALILVVINLFTLVTKAPAGAPANKSVEAATKLKTSAEKPDVYYIVPDHYMSSDVVSSQFNFDNKEFINYLESKDFRVDNDARSNYQFTTQSLASTMNMRYLDKEIKQNNGKSNSLLPLHRLIRHNDVVKNLKSLDYKYINIGSWWGVTRNNENADVNFDKAIIYTVLNQDAVPSEFEHLLISKSALSPFIEDGLKIGGYTLFQQKAIVGNDTVASALYQLEAIKQAVHTSGPKYTFMHLLVPHPEYSFDKNCNYPTSYPKATPKVEKYVNQFQCASKMLRSTVDYILENSKTEPVIIIQADEGIYPFYDGKDDSKAKNDPNLVWWDVPDKDLQAKFSILRALRMPGVDLSKYEEKLSSVNTFRILFNEYFGAEYELLPDKSYVYKNESDHYNFREVTNRLETQIQD